MPNAHANDAMIRRLEKELDAADIMRADGLARQYGLTPPVMEQPQYHMFERHKMEKEFLPVFRDLGYGTTTWSPLASGLLSGKYNNGIPENSRAALSGYDWLQKYVLTPERIAKVKQLVPVASELGCTLAQLAIAWCLQNPYVSTVITGASRPEQVTENMKALDVVPKLTPDVMKHIDEILGNKPQIEED